MAKFETIYIRVINNGFLIGAEYYSDAVTFFATWDEAVSYLKDNPPKPVAVDNVETAVQVTN